jgi:uncharacterized protein
MTDIIETDHQEVPKEERTWGMLCHLLALTGYLGIPFGGIIGPLIMWLLKKDESSFVDKCGREVLNFQITMIIAFLICVPLVFVFIGIPLMGALFIYSFIMTIIASIKANDGILYKYPFSFSFL